MHRVDWIQSPGSRLDAVDQSQSTVDLIHSTGPSRLDPTEWIQWTGSSRLLHHRWTSSPLTPPFPPVLSLPFTLGFLPPPPLRIVEMGTPLDGFGRALLSSRLVWDGRHRCGGFCHLLSHFCTITFSNADPHPPPPARCSARRSQRMKAWGQTGKSSKPELARQVRGYAPAYPNQTDGHRLLGWDLLGHDEHPKAIEGTYRQNPRITPLESS